MNKPIPTVSVIVPNYNYARYLNARIDSILKQTFQDFELILLDDCSTDNSREVLESYRNNPHVSHIIFNEQNSGSPFIQWMKGIELAKGKYIWIAEADDLAEPTFLEKCVTRLISYNSTVIAFSGSIIIDENNKTVHKQDYDRWNKKQLSAQKKYAVYNGSEYVKHNLYWKNYIYNASGTVFKKSAFHNITNFKWTKMRCCGDWLFWALITIQGDIVEVYEQLNRFRRHSVSTVATSIPNGINYEETILVINEIEKIAPTIDRYRRHVNHGKIFKQIKRQNLTSSRKKELLELINSIYNDVHLSYFIERLNKYLSLIIRSLHFSKADRCSPQKCSPLLNCND